MTARTKNFSQSETDELMRLAKKYQNDVECLKADKISSNNKDAAWLKIEEEFNKHPNCVVYRDKGTLRTKYRNLKKLMRRLHPDIVFSADARPRRTGAIKRHREPSPKEETSEMLPDIELDENSSCSSDKIMRTDGCASTPEEWAEKKCRREIEIMEAEHAKRMQTMHAEHVKRMQIMDLEIEKLRVERDILKRKLGDSILDT